MDSKTETVSDNELIAQFMGLKSFEDSRYGTLWPSPIKAKTPASVFGLCYHESWDWLMPVVEKIEAMDEIRFIIEKNRVVVMNLQNEYFWNSGTTLETKLTTTYNAVVEFIRWFNSQSPRNN